VDPKVSVAYRQALVETLRRDGHLHSPRVATALLAVPRETFVPNVSLDEVYRPSDAIVVKRLDGMSVSSASAPEVVALMLEQLDPQPGSRVLEIGAGTGYNAALLAHMVGPNGRVVTLDIDLDLVLAARAHLRRAGYPQVEVVHSDGALGYPDAAPYDRIILTVASSDIAQAWRDQLAREGGRIVMPLAIRGLQRCLPFVPDPGSDCLRSGTLRACGFVALRGMLASGPPPQRARAEAEAACVLDGEEDSQALSPEVLARLLARPMRWAETGISTSQDELRQGLQLWLVAHEPKIFVLWSGAGMPDLFGLGERVGAHGTLCLVDSAQPNLALLAWADETRLGGQLCVVTPTGGETLGEVLRGLIDEWASAGRPTDNDLEIRACARDSAPEPLPAEVAIDQRWTRFILAWSQPTSRVIWV
jgi:protein-L-isoaspartate(D-aspartate) O-methyltransferase